MKRVVLLIAFLAGLTVMLPSPASAYDGRSTGYRHGFAQKRGYGYGHYPGYRYGHHHRRGFPSRSQSYYYGGYRYPYYDNYDSYYRYKYPGYYYDYGYPGYGRHYYPYRRYMKPK